MNAPQSELDLNLENYELFDLLHVFSLPYDFTDYHIRTASKKLDKINEAKLQLPPEIPLFYQKTFVIIECLHKFREQQKLLNERYLSNHNDDGEVLKTVLASGIENFDGAWVYSGTEIATGFQLFSATSSARFNFSEINIYGYNQ